MRILMLSWEYPPRIVGGISRVVYDLAQELASSGHSVTVITMQEGEEPQEEFHESVRVFRVPAFMVRPITFIDGVMQMNFAMISKAMQLVLAGESFDVMHLHDWLVAYAGKAISEVIPGIAVVATVHATEYGRNAGIHSEVQSYISSVEQKLNDMAHVVIVNSLYMQQEIRNLFRTAEEKIRIIPNGVDVDKFANVPIDKELRRAYALDSERIVFFLGRLTYEKGVHVLMDAIPKILAACGNAKFVIGGRGPEADSIRQRAWNMGVADKVCLAGFIPDDVLLKLYKLVDIAVFPSLYEPFGIVALEGMLAQVPVVVSDAGGLNEIVSNRLNGMKFQTGNSDMLARCIVELLTNTDLARAVIRNASQSIQEKYDWDKLARMTVQAYQSAVSGDAGASE